MYNLTVSLNSESRVPAYRRLYRYFVDEISSGRLRPGEKLPSKRALCSHLGVSRSTVETAYGILVSEGYVRTRERSGFYVSEGLVFEPVSAPAAPVLEAEEEPPAPEYDFTTSSVDTSLFPYSSWAKLNKEVVYSSPELLQCGDMRGDYALRSALCRFLREYRGVRCSPSQVVVGAGMEYLSERLAQLFPQESEFAVEDPGYAAISRVLDNFGRKVHCIPLDGQGIDVDALEESGAKIAYVTPSHQFPLGLTMPADRRSRLIAWARGGNGRYIIEDDYDSEFRYSSRPLPAMQGMDMGGRVIYVGTFSRSLAPSIRIAYLVLPPELVPRWEKLYSDSRCTVSRYEQAVIARFLDEGFYSRYLRAVGALYKSRRAALVEALTSIPETRLHGDGGGIHFLLENPRFSEAELRERALGQGIALAGLSGYCRECRARESTLVVGYGGLKDVQIPAAASLLRRAWGYS